jgi:hypothetical protein
MLNKKDLKTIDLCLMLRRAQLNQYRLRLTPGMKAELDDLNEAIPKIRELRHAEEAR